MPDQCMFCWHPAQEWPDAVSYGPEDAKKVGLYSPNLWGMDIDAKLDVPVAIKRIPLCAHHMGVCLGRAVVFSVSEWWGEIEESLHHLRRKIEELGSDDGGNQIGPTAYDALHELADDILLSSCKKADVKARVDGDLFDQWIKSRLVDMARRQQRGGAHRCANIGRDCHHYVRRIGDYCGVCSKMLEKEKSEEKMTDRVHQLLEIWADTG